MNYSPNNYIWCTVFAEFFYVFISIFLHNTLHTSSGYAQVAQSASQWPSLFSGQHLTLLIFSEYEVFLMGGAVWIQRVRVSYKPSGPVWIWIWSLALCFKSLCWFVWRVWPISGLGPVDGGNIRFLKRGCSLYISNIKSSASIMYKHEKKLGGEYFYSVFLKA